MLDLDTWVFRARALGQAHPFSPRGYRQRNALVTQERAAQPSEELGVWAGHAITVGYCLRVVEEDDAGVRDAGLGPPPASLPADLDEATDHIAHLVRTEGAEPYLLSDEAHLVDVLDRVIAGEIERRLGEREQSSLDDATWEQMEEYLAWWTIKGYALRVADRLVQEEERTAEADPGPR